MGCDRVRRKLPTPKDYGAKLVFFLIQTKKMRHFLWRPDYLTKECLVIPEKGVDKAINIALSRAGVICEMQKQIAWLSQQVERLNTSLEVDYNTNEVAADNPNDSSD
ncbi:MAG: hypothetical protein NC217_07675 [Muribaculaceae bacterium]|nr:hypothetical protein [Muribaculaceae bacterium]